jgi:geranylgeranyl diphosphate synthase type 3
MDKSDTPAHSDCLPLVDSIGVLFQIVDDYRNFDDYADTKGFCDDLSEGKFSFPVIQAFAADPSNPFLLSILKQKSKDHGLKVQARDYMASVGAFDRTRQHIKSLESRTFAILEKIKVQTDQQGCEACVALRSVIEGFCSI